MDLITIQYYAVRKALINAKLRNQARRYQQGLFVFLNVPIYSTADNSFPYKEYSIIVRRH